MNIETYTKLLYIWLVLSLTFPFFIIWLSLKQRRLNKALAKQTEMTNYYEEMLYASKDGYLTYSIYNNKEYQYCSRRLATLLNLKNGKQSTLSEILTVFERHDAENINSLFNVLKNNGTYFEILAQTKTGSRFLITGTKISSPDTNTNFNCLWFRDITQSTEYINQATQEVVSCRQKLDDFRILIDNLPCPVWLRDKDQHITILNRSYLNLLGLKDFKDLTYENSVLHDLGNLTNFLEMAKTAQESNTPQKKQINILNNGDLKKYEITETPYYDSSLKTSHTIGSLIDITAFDEAKRNYRVYLDSHLDILSSLDTAFCIINTQHIFTFGNAAFIKLWNLPENFVETSPHYNLFLDNIREQKLLPEVADFKNYKDEENKAFDALTEQKEDLLYIPDGRTYRRIRAPHPDGTIIAYEDISDRLATTRKLNDLIAVQQGILNNLNDSVIIFSPTLKTIFYNHAFAKLWNISPEEINNQPNLREILDMQKISLPEVEDWQAFRDNMQQHLISCTSFTLKLKNKQRFKVTPIVLFDTSLMITYCKEQKKE